eukprot:s1774_g14.t1
MFFDEGGLGIGRHISETYQDPTLVRPGMHGVRNRTKLIKGDDGCWYVLELCGSLYNLIHMSSEFYGYEGAREVLTSVTEGEKPPALMGFTMNDDEGALQAHAHHDDDDDQDPGIMAPEDAVQGLEIAVPGLADPTGEGREIPADRVVVDAADFEKVIVNGVELTCSSVLAALRTACGFYSISQSGGKTTCYNRIVNHLKKLELELLKDAAEHATAEMQRAPHAPPLAIPPTDEEQRQHELTHTHTHLTNLGVKAAFVSRPDPTSSCVTMVLGVLEHLQFLLTWHILEQFLKVPIQRRFQLCHFW